MVNVSVVEQLIRDSSRRWLENQLLQDEIFFVSRELQYGFAVRIKYDPKLDRVIWEEVSPRTFKGLLAEIFAHFHRDLLPLEILPARGLRGFLKITALRNNMWTSSVTRRFDIYSKAKFSIEG